MRNICLNCGNEEIILKYANSDFNIYECMKCKKFIFYWINKKRSSKNITYMSEGQLLKRREELK